MTSIGENAFYGCASLTSVVIPANVTEIGEDAFHYCNRLNTVRIDADNKIFDSRENCNAIIRTTDNTLLFGCAGTEIPNSVTAVGREAFHYCEGLTAIAIPASVKSIGERAFLGCNHLAQLTLAEGVTEIGNTAFCNCTDLTDVVIPASVKEIGHSAFAECTGLANVTIKDGVAGIGEKAFLNCEKLKSITLPASVKSIGEKAFGYTDAEGDPDPNFVIRGAAGSAAESYAKSNGMVAQPAPVGKTDLSAATVTLDKDSYVYSKTACTPAVTVKLGEKTLVRGTDYSVSYSNNIHPGTAKVTVTGKGQYTGSKTVNFTITEASGTPDPGHQQQPIASITCPKTVYKAAYGAKPFRIKASADGGLTWKSSNKKIADVDKKGKVTVKGTGIAVITIRSGSASAEVTVRVSPKKPSVSSAKAAKGRKLAVKWKKDKRATGYQVQLGFTKTFKKIEKKLDTKKNACTFKKLKTGKAYYVRIRSYKKSGREKVYSAWSKPKKGGSIKR